MAHIQVIHFSFAYLFAEPMERVVGCSLRQPSEPAWGRGGGGGVMQSVEGVSEKPGAVPILVQRGICLPGSAFCANLLTIFGSISAYIKNHRQWQPYNGVDPQILYPLVGKASTALLAAVALLC